MRTIISLLPSKIIVALPLAWLACTLMPLVAQESGVIPASYQGSGSFFNRQLGTALRFNYNTEGYGTDSGVVAIGGMKVFNREGATWFLDGQATMSDDFGGGFNLGVGYRFLKDVESNFWSFDPQRITGLSFWTDGQSTEADNFFTQLGFAFESLGDSFDVRLNGHFPLENRQEGDPKLESFGVPEYVGNEIFGASEVLSIDTAYNVVDGELAKRINDLEAWAFLGGYQLEGNGDDATGYRVGVRGYAVPDLALSLQVTDDDIYSTNVMFGITWFVGRTHRGNMPCGTLLDRFREPVIRNNFIATTSETVIRESGDPLTDATTNEAFHIVHVDSNDGSDTGDGTYENPYRTLDQASGAGNSEEGSIILVHGGSSFTGSEAEYVAQANQRILGEGLDPFDMSADPAAIIHQIDTNEIGIISLPETAVGASTMAAPTIDGTGLTNIFTLANDNELNNFVINNGATAVSAVGVANPTLSNLDINDQTGTAVVLENTTGTALVENTVDISGADGIGLQVNGGNEVVTVAASLTNNEGIDLDIRNRTGGTVTYSGILQDNAGGGIVIDSNADAVVNLTNTATEDRDGNSIDNGINIENGDGTTAIAITGNTSTAVTFSGTVGVDSTGTGAGVDISGNDDASAVTFADLDATAVNGNTFSVTDGGTINVSSADDTRTIENTGTGTAFINEDNAVTPGNASITINSDIVNSGGGNSIRIANRTDNDVLINGTVTETGAASMGISVENNTGGNIVFNDLVTIGEMGTGTAGGVELLNNAGTTMLFTGIDIETAGTANGFSATGGGTLTVLSPTDTSLSNEIVVAQGIGLELEGMTIAASSAVFDVVDVTNGANEGIRLVNIDGDGNLTIGSGTDPGDGGTITSAGPGVLVDNVDLDSTDTGATNLTVQNLMINNGAGTAEGVRIVNQVDGSVSNFNNLEINTLNGNGVTIGDETVTAGSSNDGGTININDLASTTSGTGDAVSIDNADTSTATITLADLDLGSTGSGRGFVATGGGDIDISGTNTIDTNTGVAFEANNVEDLTAADVTIDNSTTAGGGVLVTALDNGTDIVTLNNFDVTTDTGNAVEVSANTDGTVAITGLTAESANGNTVFLDNNGATAINIVDMTAEATGSGDAFTAQDGGVLSLTGTNNVTANTGQGVNIDGTINDVEIAAAGATFTDVTVTNGSSTGINIDSTTGTGQVSVEAATLTTAGTALNVDNAMDVAVADVAIDNSATAGAGVSVTGGSTFEATGTNTIATSTGTAININSSTIGTNGASFDTVDVSNAAGAGISLTDVDGGTVTIGSGTNAGDGGTITSTGTGINIDNVESLVVQNVTVDNALVTNGIGVSITDQEAGSSAAFTGLTVNSNNSRGVLVNGNIAGTTSFSSLTVNAVGNGDGVFVNNNGTATTSFTSIDITTAAGDGFTATNSGTVTANGANTITTDTGVGLNVADTTIGGTGLSFNSVDVTNGSTNGIVLTNATGGQIRVGSTTASGTDGDGGTLTTADTAIVVDQVSTAVFNDVTVDSASGNSVEVTHSGTNNSTVTFDNLSLATNGGSADAIVVTDDGTGELDFTLSNSTVDSSASDTVAFRLVTNDNAGEIDVRLQGNTMDALNESVVLANINNGTGDIQFLINGNTMNNNSAANETVAINNTAARTVNATIGDQDSSAPFDANSFTNAGGIAVGLSLDNLAGRINLDLRGNTASGSGAIDYQLTETNGDFGVVDLANTVTAETNNTGVIDLNGGVEADFDDLAPPIKQVD